MSRSFSKEPRLKGIDSALFQGHRVCVYVCMCMCVCVCVCVLRPFLIVVLC